MNEKLQVTKEALDCLRKKIKENLELKNKPIKILSKRDKKLEVELSFILDVAYMSGYEKIKIEDLWFFVEIEFLKKVTLVLVDYNEKTKTFTVDRVFGELN